MAKKFSELQAKMSPEAQEGSIGKLNELLSELPPRKRDIFAELVEGFDALDAARKGEVTLKTSSAPESPDS